MFSHNLKFKENKSASVYLAASGTCVNQMMNSSTARFASQALLAESGAADLVTGTWLD